MMLFYTPGTSSLFPHIVLREADLAFEKIKVDEHTKLMDNGGDCRTVNPLGFVPALGLDDGTVLTEGVAIVQYIADKVPAKQLAPPNGTLERAKLQSWLNFIASEMQMGCFCPLFHSTTSDAAKTMYHARLASRLATSIAICLTRNTCWGTIFRWRTPTCSLCRTGAFGQCRPYSLSSRACSPQTHWCKTGGAVGVTSGGTDLTLGPARLCTCR